MWPSYLGRRGTSGWQLSANCKTITKRAPDPRTQATSRRSTSPAPNLPLIFIGHGTGWRWQRCFRVQLGQEGLAMKSARPTAHPPCRFRLPLVGKSVWFRAPELPVAWDQSGCSVECSEQVPAEAPAARWCVRQCQSHTTCAFAWPQGRSPKIGMPDGDVSRWRSLLTSLWTHTSCGVLGRNSSIPSTNLPSFQNIGRVIGR